MYVAADWASRAQLSETRYNGHAENDETDADENVSSAVIVWSTRDPLVQRVSDTRRHARPSDETRAGKNKKNSEPVHPGRPNGLALSRANRTPDSINLGTLATRFASAAARGGRSGREATTSDCVDHSRIAERCGRYPPTKPEIPRNQAPFRARMPTGMPE